MMKKLWILILPLLLSGCTALNTVTANNKDKVVTIASETWGGKIVAEMVSIGESFLPNLTICFGKTFTYYNATPATIDPALAKALAVHVEAAKSTIKIKSTGIEDKK
jgi:hypothetical protein